MNFFVLTKLTVRLPCFVLQMSFLLPRYGSGAEVQWHTRPVIIYSCTNRNVADFSAPTRSVLDAWHKDILPCLNSLLLIIAIISSCLLS